MNTPLIPLPAGNDLIGRYLRRAARVDDREVHSLAEASRALLGQLDGLDAAHPYPGGATQPFGELAAGALSGPVDEAEEDHASLVTQDMAALVAAYRAIREQGGGTTGQWVKCLEAFRRVVWSASAAHNDDRGHELFVEMTQSYAPLLALRERLEAMTHPDKARRPKLGDVLDELVPVEWQGRDFVAAMTALSKEYLTAYGDSDGAALAREGRAKLLRGDQTGWTAIWDATAVTDRSPPPGLEWTENIAIAMSLVYVR